MTDQWFSPAKQDPAAIPFRNKFDAARDPLTARNALGIDAAITTALAAVPNLPITNAQLTDMAQATIKGRATGAGTGDPTDLTGTQAGAIIAPAWTAYTPTIGAGAGTFTSVSATGKYLTIGKLTHVVMKITIVTNGSAGNWITATLPIAAVGTAVLMGSETVVSGKTCSGRVAGSNVIIIFYDASYPGANSAVIDLAGTYENS